MGPDTVNTLPPNTIDAVLHEGNTEVTIRDDLTGAHAVIEQLERLGIHMDAVTDKLTIDGVRAFVESFDELLAGLARKEEQLRAVG